jgi:hypothetical protein
MRGKGRILWLQFGGLSGRRLAPADPMQPKEGPAQLQGSGVRIQGAPSQYSTIGLWSFVLPTTHTFRASTAATSASSPADGGPVTTVQLAPSQCSISVRRGNCVPANTEGLSPTAHTSSRTAAETAFSSPSGTNGLAAT